MEENKRRELIVQAFFALFVLLLLVGSVTLVLFPPAAPPQYTENGFEKTPVTDAETPTLYNMLFTRAGERLVVNDEPDTRGYPYILEATIIEEKDDKIIFDVQYSLPEQAPGTYSISIHPNMGDWGYNSNQLKVGENSEIITLSFLGKKSKETHSGLMHIYINYYENDSYVGKVFDRTVRFTKEWKK